jgi:hypothetical protein
MGREEINKATGDAMSIKFEKLVVVTVLGAMLSSIAIAGCGGGSEEAPTPPANAAGVPVPPAMASNSSSAGAPPAADAPK